VVGTPSLPIMVITLFAFLHFKLMRLNLIIYFF
jgi:hypothetical protein